MEADIGGNLFQIQQELWAAVQGEMLTALRGHQNLAFPSGNLELTVGVSNEHRGSLNGSRRQTGLDAERMTCRHPCIDPANGRSLGQFDTGRPQAQLRIAAHPELQTNAKQRLRAQQLTGAGKPKQAVAMKQQLVT